MDDNPDLNYDFFMTTAFLVAQRSKSPEKVGACIVNERNQIVGIGHNSVGCADIAFHAELTAIAKASQRVKNCTLFVTLHPCNECAKLIIQCDIRKVVYSHDKWPEVRKLLEDYGVELVCHVPLPTSLSIHFRNSEESAEYPGMNWNHFFMATAYLVAQFNNSQVGSCIVNEENQIVSIGYMKTSNKRKPHMDGEESMGETFHAELNAIKNTSQPLDSCTLYVSVFPCTKCAPHIADAGIKKVVYNYDKYPNSPKKLQDYGIECVHYRPPYNINLLMEMQN